MAAAAGGALLLAPAIASAHKPSDSYLALDVTDGVAAARGTWDVALRDLDYVLALDHDGDGAITRGELGTRAAEIRRYVLDRLVFTVSGATARADQPCHLRAGELALAEHSDGSYLRLPLALACPEPGPTLHVDYRLFFEVDSQHRGILRMIGPGAPAAPILLDAHEHHRAFPVGPGSARAMAAGVPTMIAAGARHIGGGLDHLLFLLALLLPSVLRRAPEDRGWRGWAPVTALRPALADVARVVSAFTVAHSLTLTLAALGLARMPGRLVEPAIAASVAIAAANNLWPLFGRDRWAVAFALGLLHGFGFSSALADGGFSGARLAFALLGFNLGVELGQLTLCAVFLPLAFVARGTAAYRRGALAGGSFAALTLACVWFVERALDVRLITWSSR
jgi:hypothetical protein